MRAAQALLVLALPWLALSCAPRRAAERAPVEFWVSWPIEAVAPLVATFEAENPGLRVHLRHVPLSAQGDSVTLAVESGHPPDLCQLSGGSMPAWLAQGSLSDWSAGVADLRGILRGWELCMVGDAVYGLPWTLRAPVLIYEKRLFARAGLDSSRAPATWEELRKAAGRVQALRGGVHGFGVPSGSTRELASAWLPWAWGNGGELFTAGLDSSRVGEPAPAQALEHLVALRRNGLAAPQDSLEREFLAGRLGMFLADATFAQASARAGRRAGVALVPRPAADRGASSSWADGEVLVSFTASRHKEQALKLARFLVQPASALALVATLPGAWPSRVDAESSAWFLERPVALVAQRQLASARFTPHPRDWPALEARLGEAVWEALSGRASPSRALASADSFVASQLGSR